MNYQRLGLVCALAVVLVAVAACSDGDKDNEPYVPNPTGEAYNLKSKTQIFGFIGQKRYAYCPSVLMMPDGSHHIYFCGNPNGGTMVDNIYHMVLQSNNLHTTPQSVLQPGESVEAWDNQHTCDPSVVEGSFCYDGTLYRYAMFYLGCTTQYYYNEIGVAFANDLSADNWVKYPSPIVSKTWNGEGDQEYASGLFSWGVGQPSAISLDKHGKLLLSYTVGDKDGTRIMLRDLDFSDMDAPFIGDATTMSAKGLLDITESKQDYTCNADIALDVSDNSIVMIRPVQPHPSEYPSYINSTLEIDRLSLTDFRNGIGTWTPLYRLSPYATGFPRNHNACIARDTFGHLTETSSITVYYTISRATPDVAPAFATHAEWSYVIWKGVIAK